MESESRFFPKNIMEELVSSKLDEYMSSGAVCNCDRCRADVLAMTLNRLPPKYVVSVSGDVYSRYETMKAQLQADVTMALLNAIQVINTSPRHSGELEHTAVK
jgi:competence protein ComFB